MEFLKLNLLYGHKCRKTIFNKLYKVGTPEYKNCVLQKGKI
jgi:rod shape-determining protein MreC